MAKSDINFESFMTIKIAKSALMTAMVVVSLALLAAVVLP